MPSVMKISEAASLALHTMALLADSPGVWISLREIAEALGVSENHLAKVLQRLVRRGLLVSTRGPRGGFRLAVEPERVTLLDVYEAIEGPYRVRGCMFAHPRCEGECIVGGLIGSVNRQVKETLANASLSDLPALFGRGR